MCVLERVGLNHLKSKIFYLIYRGIQSPYILKKTTHVLLNTLFLFLLRALEVGLPYYFSIAPICDFLFPQQ